MQRNEDGAAGGATNDQQQQLKCPIDANSGPDFQINLNEFLEFLKLSCHVNDMIAKADMGKSHTREPIPPMEGAGGGGNQAKRQTKREEFDFDTLAENHLVNELLGLKRLKHHRHSTTTTTNTTSSTTTTNTNTTSITATTSSSRDESRTNLLMAGNETKSLRSGPGHVHGGGGGRGRHDSLATYKGLHPKLSEQLDAVINEGVLDSVLSFICPVPVPVPLATNARNKPKQQQQQQQQQQHMPPAAKDILTLPTNPAPAIGAAKSMTEMSSYSNSSLPVTTSAPALQQQATEMDGIASSSASNNLMRAMVKEPSTSKGSLNTTGRRKSLLLVKDSKHLRQEKREPEVVIHVCDEVKNTSRDFTCPQSLLVSKMGYFADVTAGQRLEEMDISVHCDILIFDWLMKWIKHSAQSQELPNPSQTSNHASSGPQLDGNNVVPILVSASFLQMEPLLLECLTFCHAHLSEVVRTSTNLSCLNDALVTRLAAMFTNLELEIVRDKKERVTPRLWTKLIQSLSEPEPEALRGHFYSMSGLFRCIRCFSCVTNTMKSYMNCTPSNIRLNRWGQLMSGHVRDPNWDLNIYIMQLFKELKSWRKVYWKLWGHCHYLYCCTCEAHFPVYQMNWCRYHPEAPNFLGPVGNAGPAGRYACCGQQAFRYETLPGPNGCQFREHSVLVETDRERAILAIAQLVAENFALCELPPLRIQELAAAGEINPSWQGISLTPQRCRQGLLPQLCMDMTNHRVSRRMRGSRYQIDTSTDSETTSTSEEDARTLRPRMRNAMNHNDDDDSSESSDGCESEHHHRPPPRKARGKKGRKRPTEVSGRFWSGELSARSNQDHQRDFEEKIMKQVATYVTKKTGSDQSLVQNAKPLGGTYVRLETEWKEMLKQRHSNHNLPNNSTGLAGGGVGGGPGGAAGGGIGPGGGNAGSILSSSSNTLMSGSIPLGGMGGCGGPTLGSSAPSTSKQKHK